MSSITIKARDLNALVASVKPILAYVDRQLPVLRTVQVRSVSPKTPTAPARVEFMFTDRYVAVRMDGPVFDYEGAPNFLLPWDEFSRMARGWKPTSAESRDSLTPDSPYTYTIAPDGVTSWLGTWRFPAPVVESLKGAQAPPIEGLTGWDNDQEDAHTRPAFDPLRLANLSKSVAAWTRTSRWGKPTMFYAGNLPTSPILLRPIADAKPEPHGRGWRALLMPIRATQ